MITDEDLKMLIAQRKMERDINKNLKEFIDDASITVSNGTRLLHQHPKLLKMIDDFIDKMEAK